MNVFYNRTTDEVEKKLFSLKTIPRDGLILQIHNTISYKCDLKRIRFIQTAFDNSGTLAANGDIDGNVFILDFSANKFWWLAKFNSCSVLAFCPTDPCDLIVGCNDGHLYFVNHHLGTLTIVLQDHICPVKSISFANNECLTASLSQAIIYDIKTFTKIHELSIESTTSLKQIFYMPITHNIIACFSDDYIHVWKNNTFESFKKLLPTEWNKFCLKSIAITRNGSTMVLAGISSKLIVFSLDHWVLTKILNLSEDLTVKYIDFATHPHDGGANKYLIVLSGSGILHFLDMEQCIVTYKIQVEREIISFATSSNGNFLACILKSGEINFYKLSYFTETVNEPCPPICKEKSKMKLCLLPPKQPRQALDLGMLQGILKEFGEYPEAYRLLIWSKILLLPNNKKSFASIVKKGYNKHFDKIDKMYPIINASVSKNLKHLLSNLANWNEIFCHVEFLPLFVFPFVKIFENEPVMCFEAVMTVILNWCQHWFEYMPCVPVNTLAIIENVLNEHDTKLLQYLTSQGVTSHLYAWPLLETAFSEILPIKEWCILWDHILSNEPAFMLMIPVAYNIICRLVLATYSNPKDFEKFYHSQNPIGIKKLVAKTYYLLENTSAGKHPRQYLSDFVQLPVGSYTTFEESSKITVKLSKSLLKKQSSASKKSGSFPQTYACASVQTQAHGQTLAQGQTLAHGQTQTQPQTQTKDVGAGDSEEEWDNTDSDDTDLEMKKIEKELNDIKQMKEKEEKSRVMKIEEAKRVEELQKMHETKIFETRERAHKRKMELSKLKTELFEMQAAAIETSRKQIEETNLRDRKRELNKMLKQLEQATDDDDLQIQLAEEELSRYYVELIQQKMTIENLLLQSIVDESDIPEAYKVRECQRKKLTQEMDEIRRKVAFNRLTNKASIPIGISMANDRTQRIDMAVAHKVARDHIRENQSHGNLQIVKMKHDTAELENDVQNLLQKFTQAKIREADYVVSQLETCICDNEKASDKITID